MDDRDLGRRILNGWSGMRLFLLGVALMGCAAATAWMFVASLFMGGFAKYWLAFWIPVGSVCVIAGSALLGRGWWKLGKEKAQGYTSSAKDAWEDPELYLLDPVSLHVRLAPGERDGHRIQDEARAWRILVGRALPARPSRD